MKKYRIKVEFNDNKGKFHKGHMEVWEVNEEEARVEVLNRVAELHGINKKEVKLLESI